MRVFVTGPTGSGKSTLASALAAALSAPCVALDEMHWIRDPAGDRRRDAAERSRLLDRAVQGECRVIEGVQSKWAGPAIERADRIVVLDPPRPRTVARLLRRFLRRVVRGHRRGTLPALMQEMRWLGDYHRHERAMLFERLRRRPDRVLVTRSRRDERALPDRVLGTGRPLAGLSPGSGSPPGSSGR